MGHNFRRQVALGPFIVDLVCFDTRLIVEVDGGQHGDERHAKRDAARTAWLEGEGFRVLRFWNNEVMDNMDGVLAAIVEAL